MHPGTQLGIFRLRACLPVPTHPLTAHWGAKNLSLPTKFETTELRSVLQLPLDSTIINLGAVKLSQLEDVDLILWTSLRFKSVKYRGRECRKDGSVWFIPKGAKLEFVEDLKYHPEYHAWEVELGKPRWLKDFYEEGLEGPNPIYFPLVKGHKAESITAEGWFASIEAVDASRGRPRLVSTERHWLTAPGALGEHLQQFMLYNAMEVPADCTEVLFLWTTKQEAYHQSIEKMDDASQLEFAQQSDTPEGLRVQALLKLRTPRPVGATKIKARIILDLREAFRLMDIEGMASWFDFRDFFSARLLQEHAHELLELPRAAKLILDGSSTHIESVNNAHRVLELFWKHRVDLTTTLDVKVWLRNNHWDKKHVKHYLLDHVGELSKKLDETFGRDSPLGLYCLCDACKQMFEHKEICVSHAQFEQPHAWKFLTVKPCGVANLHYMHGYMESFECEEQLQWLALSRFIHDGKAFWLDYARGFYEREL